MSASPVSLDELIGHVKTMSPEGGPLDNLADAVGVGADLDETSDALIGHFVDRARRSGATWSQIGASMGVTKQAAQKRFVTLWEGADFSRFTQRSRNVLAAAGGIAAGTGRRRWSTRRTSPRVCSASPTASPLRSSTARAGPTSRC